MIGLDAAEILIAVVMIFATTALAIIGYLIRDAISNFRLSVEKLDKTIYKLGEDISDHNTRISVLESKDKDKK